MTEEIKKEEVEVLVVVDMQKGFITKPLGTPQAEALVPRLVEFLKNFNGYVVATQDTHGENYSETLEGIKLNVPHCIEGHEDWQIDPDVLKAMEAKGDKFLGIITKPTFGSFELPMVIAEDVFGVKSNEVFAQGGFEQNIGKIIVGGLCTDICVLNNAAILRAAFPNTIIEVRADLTEGVTPEAKETALKAMEALQIDVVR